MSDQNAAAIAALLAEDSRFAFRLNNVEKITEPDARILRLQIAVKLCPDACRKYVELGGPLASEFAQHLPANDSAPGDTQWVEANAKAVADMDKAKQLAPHVANTSKPKPTPAKSEKKPPKYLKPEVPKGYNTGGFPSVPSALEAVRKLTKSSGEGSNIAFCIGWGAAENEFTDADIDMLATELAEAMGTTKVKAKALIKRGRWKLNPKRIAFDKEQERNAPRGEGYDFLIDTDYVVNDDGTMIGVNERHGDKEEFSAICGAFSVLGKVKDQDRGSWGLRIAYRDFDGAEHQTTVNSADWNGDPRALRSSLADQGFNVVPYAKFTLERLFADIMPRVETTLTIYSRPGWHDARYVSVLGGVIGEDADSAVLSDRTGSEDREKKGTLAGWKLAANELAGLNDHWSIGLAAGFAGILIDRCGLDTAAACISGPTSDGKTIALTLSASVHGNPKERASVLHPLRVTENSIERLFESASGATISLDELALAEPRAVGVILMLLASGSGKSRMTKSTALGRVARWRGFVLFSSERSLRNIVEGAKGQWLGGHAVRCVDIATTGARRHDPAYIRALGQKLKDNYGHAAPIFAQHLLDMGEAGEPGKLRERIAAAAKSFTGDGASPAQARAAHTFAVLAVAASIAEKAGLIDDAGAVTDALLRGWARYAAGDELRAADPVKEALERLADYVATNRNHTILPLPKKGDDLGVMGRGSIGVDDEREERAQHREAWGYYDDGTIYVVKDRLIAMAGGVVKYADLRRGLGTNLVKRGDKDFEWLKLPISGRKLSHYRIKAAFFEVEGDE